MTLIALIIGLLAYYYFILRKYNTLGFRLFSLCVFVSGAMVFWWWTDWRELKRMEREGKVQVAFVYEKVQKGSDWAITMGYTNEHQDLVFGHCDRSMAVEELAAVVPHGTAPIRYRSGSSTVFLESSFQRLHRDHATMLILPAFFMLLGSAAWFFLRRYRIHPHEGTAYEYMTDETGKVVLDDAKNETTKSWRKANLVSKIIQLLGKG